MEARWLFYKDCPCKLSSSEIYVFETYPVVNKQTKIITQGRIHCLTSPQWTVTPPGFSSVCRICTGARFNTLASSSTRDTNCSWRSGDVSTVKHATSDGLGNSGKLKCKMWPYIVWLYYICIYINYKQLRFFIHKKSQYKLTVNIAQENAWI